MCDPHRKERQGGPLMSHPVPAFPGQKGSQPGAFTQWRVCHAEMGPKTPHGGKGGVYAFSLLILLAPFSFSGLPHIRDGLKYPGVPDQFLLHVCVIKISFPFLS